MSYVKDSRGIIINTDDSYYRALLAQRESSKRASEVCEQVDTLKAELEQVKSLLAQVINRN